MHQDGTVCQKHLCDAMWNSQNDSASFPVYEKFVAIFLFVFPHRIRAPLIWISKRFLHSADSFRRPSATASWKQQHAPHCFSHCVLAGCRRLCVRERPESESWNGTMPLFCVLYLANKFMFGSKVVEISAMLEIPFLCTSFKLAYFYHARPVCLTRFINLRSKVA